MLWNPLCFCQFGRLSELLCVLIQEVFANYMKLEGNSSKMVISDEFGLMGITDRTSFPSGYLYN